MISKVSGLYLGCNLFWKNKKEVVSSTIGQTLLIPRKASGMSQLLHKILLMQTKLVEFLM